MKRSNDLWWVWMIVTVVLVAGMIVFFVRDCNARAKCEDNGGRVVEYDCRTTFVTNSCGSGCFYTTPVTTCKWRCEGVNAEVSP